MRKIMWTTDSKELRIMIAVRSKMLEWNSSGVYGDIKECLILDSYSDHIDWAFRKNIKQEYEYIEPEVFIAECARRFPKKKARAEKEILAEIENLFTELKSVMK